MSNLLLHTYHRLPVLVQNITISSYGLYLHRRRYGGICLAHDRFLRANEALSPTEIREVQCSMLRRVLTECVAVTPWYRDAAKRLGFRWSDVRAPEDLASVPFLEKDDIRRASADFRSNRPRGERCYFSSTSGTTGTPLTIWMNRTTERLSYAFYLRQMRWMGVRMGEARATFFGRVIIPPAQSAPPFWRHDWSENNWQFSSYHLSPTNLPHYLRKLEDVRPVEIRGYPSSVVAIARAALADGTRRIRPRAVHLTAETLRPEWLVAIKEAFRAPVYDHYGSSEMSHMISQCDHGTYHQHPEYGIVEVLRNGRPVEPGGSGEVVATSFVALAMPLVRYRIGDQVELSGEPCACGRAFPTFRRILGREDDVLVTPDGRQIGRLDPVFKGGGGLLESQIVQTEPDRVVLRFVPAADYVEGAEVDVIRRLQDRLGPTVSVIAERVDEIPRTRGGKFRSVVGLQRAAAPEFQAPEPSQSSRPA